MTAREKLKALDEEIAAAARRQDELRRAKATAVRAVNEKREALVARLAEDLDGCANTEQKGLAAAEKKASEPWDARVEAAGRIVAQARQRREAFIGANADRLLAEMAAPARDWPERARAALEQLEAVAVEYDHIGAPIERLAREAGRQLRVPDNPIDLRPVRQMLAADLHAPIPDQIHGIRISPLDDPDDEVRQMARARFIRDNEGRAA